MKDFNSNVDLGGLSNWEKNDGDLFCYQRTQHSSNICLLSCFAKSTDRTVDTHVVLGGSKSLDTGFGI